MLNAPVRHSDKLHVVERFTLDPATNTLTRTYTAEDPVYLKGQDTGRDVIGIADQPYTEDKCKEQGFIDYSKQVQRSSAAARLKTFGRAHWHARCRSPVEGRLRKFVDEVVLLRQPFIIDPERTVEQALAEASANGGSADPRARVRALPRRRGGGAVTFFPGFERRAIETRGATIHTVWGGSGPPLLLLHGSPQTHVMWHKVAPRLAESFTVVMTDLRGYGDSSKPAGGGTHEDYSKRAMANDQVQVMRALGFDRFAVAGHDRGARVTWRLAVEQPEVVTRAAVLDIVPLPYSMMSQAFATEYYHWFFLIQPAPLPETLIGNSAEFYVRGRCRERDGITPEALCGVPALLHAGGDSRQLRGLSRRRDDRPRARGGRRRPSGGMSAAGAVGRAGHCRPPLRRDGRVAPPCARRAGTRAARPPLHRRGAP